MSWGNGYIQDWSTEGGLQFAPVLYVGLDLVNALEERMNVLGLTVLEGFEFFDRKIDSLDLSGNVFNPHLEGRESILTESGPPIHDKEGDSINLTTERLISAIDSILIGYLCRDDYVVQDIEEENNPNENPELFFVDYFNKNGLWTKTTSRAPRLTRNDVLKYLGQDEFIRLGSYDSIYRRIQNRNSIYFSPLLASWARQCYRILNLFRWTDVTWVDIDNPSFDGVIVRRGTGNTYEEAVADYNANGWELIETQIIGDLIYSGTDFIPGKYFIERGYVSDLENTGIQWFENHQFVVETTKFNYDADLYVYPIQIHNAFNKDKRGWLKDQYNYLGSYKNQNGNKLFDFRDFGPTDAPAKAPPGADSYGWQIDQRQLDPDKVSYTILKWDVTNGFNYISDDNNDYVT